MRRFPTCELLSVLILAPVLVGAQNVSTEPESRIRFRIGVSDSVNVAGLELLTLDSLILESCATCGKLRYARAEVSHIEMYRGSTRGSHMIGGAAIGALVGIGIGTITVKTSCHCDRDEL